MKKPKVSIIIPSRNEQFLAKTVDDIFNNATGSIEVLTVLDGYWPAPILQDRPNLVIIHRGQAQGMRPAINSAASIAKGEYLMKCDAHCMFAEGFDEVLQADCDDDWVVVPRRYSLDAENWERKKKGPTDYHYLQCPLKSNDGALHGRPWNKRRDKRRDILIDDEMSSQGSCWFMSRRHWDWLGGLHLEGYGDFIQEFQEIGMKTWLGGGQVKINKNTWYAHLHKGNTYGRGYKVSRSSWHRGCHYSADLWLNNRWEERVHDFKWLIEKFWPVPTWPEDYHSLWSGTEWTHPIKRNV